jgi:anti-sigma factor (TIGR02949 family)
MIQAMTERFDCDEVVRRLWPHLDGALPESERARVVAHLEECDGCRSHHDFAQAFLDAVRRAAPVDRRLAVRPGLSFRIARSTCPLPPAP